MTRVYEGDGGPVLRELLEEKVLPLAAHEGNRWLASWAFWMLRRRDMAVRALIVCQLSVHYECHYTDDPQSPVYTLLETPQSPDMQAKLYLTDDPALVVLYSHLRQKTLQTLRGASKVTPKVEWAFVLHSARLYDRMGCDLLALDLGKISHQFEHERDLCRLTNRIHSAQLGVSVAGSDNGKFRERGRPAKNASAKKFACCCRFTRTFPPYRRS
jgi:hypothetical protein